jgi:hypothetical protein
MKMHPNRTDLEVIVRGIEPSLDGIGATVEVQVIRSLALSQQPDFVCAQAGQVLRLFAAAPAELQLGGCYHLATSMAGGPNAERLVICSADRIDRHGGMEWSTGTGVAS